MNGRHAGFTLVELLVVIAVMALLAALLLPALAAAKAKARSARCQSNLRQIGMALVMYVHDHGKYPGGILYEHGRLWEFHHGVNWSDPIDRYLPGSDSQNFFPDADVRDYSRPAVFVCPAAPLRKREDYPKVGESRWMFQMGYGYNHHGTGWKYDDVHDLGLGPRRVTADRRAPGPNDVFNDGGPPPPTILVETSENQIRVPSEMIAVGDNISFSSEVIAPRSPTPGTFDTGPSPGTRYYPLLGDRHSSGCNLVFCDGHVEYGKTEKVIKPTEGARRRWNRDNQPHPDTW